jgi:hypothetical protein
MQLRSQNWVVVLLFSAVVAHPAQAQYTATVLPIPAGSSVAQVYAAREGQQVGFTSPSYGHALLWNNVSGSTIDLNVGSYGSIAYATSQGYQGGDYIATLYHTGGSGKGGGGARTYLIPHAALWHGSADSMTDLNPVGEYQSKVLGIGNGQQVGWASATFFSAVHAYLWSGTVASAVDLEPAGFSQSEAVAIDSKHPIGLHPAITTGTVASQLGGIPITPIPVQPINPVPVVGNSAQVGYGYVTATGAIHALLWYSTAASAVDLHPTEFAAVASYAQAVDAETGQQAGYVTSSSATTTAQHACLWSGTAASAIDLNPAGYSWSEALALHGGYQAGYGGTLAGQTHALLWHGSAASALDLHTFLPSNFVSSQAFGMDLDGSIVGSASDGHITYPIVWKPSAVPDLVVTQDVPPDASGWSTQNVTLTLTSPFTTISAVISYRINGGAIQQVTSSVATLLLSASDTYQVEAFATNGQGQKTPWQAYTVNIDQTPPQTILSYVDFMLQLTATDANSGVASTSYILDGGATTSYSKPIMLDNIAHTVEYWSTDKVGNVETHHIAALAPTAPTLTSLSPSILLSGGPAFTLIVTGTGFIPNSTVQWNGSARATTYVSTTQLQVAILDTDIATAGTAQITVTNPAPGTGTSTALTFTIPQRSVATGSATGFDDGSTTFDLDPVTSYSGFTLNAHTVHVITNASTTFLDASGNVLPSASFFNSLEDGQNLQVVGTYDASTRTLTAWTVQMQ